MEVSTSKDLKIICNQLMFSECSLLTGSNVSKTIEKFSLSLYNETEKFENSRNNSWSNRLSR